jgi:transposase
MSVRACGPRNLMKAASVTDLFSARGRRLSTLKAMADWLKQCGICTVAMQSTGVYWIAVFDILKAAGLEVYLVNARRTCLGAKATCRRANG